MLHDHNKFYEEVFSVLFRSYFRSPRDNWDTYRYGSKLREKPVRRFIREATNLLQLVKYRLASLGFVADRQLEPFKYLYSNLELEKDRSLLVQLVAYRIFGPEKIVLPTNSNGFLNQVQALERLENKVDYIQVRFNNLRLYRIDLRPLQIPIEFYYSAYGTYIDFVLEQYRYNSDQVSLEVKDGDVVIDAGGCWGDTSLYFANLVGKKGHVFTYEFIPSNLDVLRKNVELNSDLAKRITIVDQPVWDVSDLKLNYIDNGPASRVSFSALEGANGQASTLSIDDLVVRHDVRKVDFVKMDIEGAEMRALQGGVNMIKRFKPTLALAIYHDPNDFRTIANWIRSLDLGYRFFLKHATIHTEETILFASPL